MKCLNCLKGKVNNFKSILFDKGVGPKINLNEKTADTLSKFKIVVIEDDE